MSANVTTLLPELVLTVAGVLIMLADSMLKPGASRKLLGWFAVVATVLAGAASYYQLIAVERHQGALLGFSGTIQVDAFSVFFHLVIAAVVLVTLLGSLDYFEGNALHAGEYFALVLFGAVGMFLMTCSAELLMVFIGLEISSISTYIMAGFRKGNGAGAESSLKYFLLGSFATAFLLYGIALIFGATGSTSIPTIAAVLSGQLTTALPPTPTLAFLALGMILIGLGFKVSAAPVPGLDTRCLPGRAGTHRRPDVHRAQGGRLRRYAAHHLPRLWRHAGTLAVAAVDHGRAVHVSRQPWRAQAEERQAHAGLLLHCQRRLPAGRVHRLPA